MKKLLLIPLVIVLAVGLLLSGCGESAEPAEPTIPTTPTEPTEPAEPTEPTEAAEQEVIKLKFATFHPLGDVLDKNVIWPWMEEVEELTNGRVKIDQYGGMALGSTPQHYELALSGTADISEVDAGAVPGVFPLLEIGSLPLVFPSSEVAGIVTAEVLEKHVIGKGLGTGLDTVKLLWYMPTGINQLTTRAKQVATMEDLEGMKIVSTQSMTAKALDKLGAVPVVQPPTEMYTSLERGLADGVLMEWTGIGETWQFYDVTKYRTDNVNFCTASLGIVMNLDSWNSLPPDIQKIFNETAGVNLSRRAGKSFDEDCVRVREVVREYDEKVGNPPIYELPAAERVRWSEAVKPMIAEWVAERAAKELPAQAMLDDLYTLVEKYSAE